MLLVGGPGNGKTEAVEDAIRELEESLAIDGEISGLLSPIFDPADGSTVPRSVTVDLTQLGSARALTLTLVQDASVGEAGGASAAECLVADLEHAIPAGSGHLYLACVNRGILDDALISAQSTDSTAKQLASTIVGALATRVGAPSCWPLVGWPEVAIWPMDVESLFLKDTAGGTESPALQALSLATDPHRWPEYGSCPAGERCPFCLSRSQLEREPHRSSFLWILRGYELSTGKRWSFRDLLSLLSYLLAGSPPEEASGPHGPCEWAASLLPGNQDGAGITESRRLAAPFLLVAAQYQHALFGAWPALGRFALRRELREVGLEHEPTLRGLGIFLSRTQAVSVPRTLRTELAALTLALDPSSASPDLDVALSGSTTVKLREIDARFSHSVRDGFEILRRHRSLSVNEMMLLKSLADADDQLGAPEVRNRKPTTAAALQVLVRDFSCRLVRRSLGAKNAVVKDSTYVHGFTRLVADDDELAHDAAKRVEGLLNNRMDRFTITLNSTFGEPPPPITKRVMLETPKQRVRPARPDTNGRPRSDLRFLTVGSHTSTQHVPLTYELFRAVQEMQAGMLAASLPRPVVAALDAARARLAGRIVRSGDALDGAEISIGNRSERIVIDGHRFIVRSGRDQ
ncbi:MAG: hypothetical protein DYH12_03705 [Sorangiineae bacterium PRO1]|nr:hypothetical protein [Sorangiineae bacterium PRO1]